MKISNASFVKIADEVVPGMRLMMSDLGQSGVSVTPSVRMTATVLVDDVDARVRITVELDPEDDED